MELKEALNAAEVIRRANPASQAMLASFGALRHLRHGAHLFLDRDKVSTIYILINGLASLYKINSEGEKRVIFILGPGKLINEVIFDDLPASASCEMLEDSVILCLNKANFLAVMQHDFELTRAVMGSLSVKVRRLYRQLKNTSGSVRGDKRIAAKLWKLSLDHGVPEADGVRIDMKLSVTCLANMLGAKRETVSRQLKILSSRGLIVMKGSVFTIPNRDNLSRFFKFHSDEVPQ
jgi:CRP-like cAMP-binding protein